MNRRWARVKVPGCGWFRFRLSARGKGARLPAAKTFRVTCRNGQWHIAFPVVPDPVEKPGTGEAIGIDWGVRITAAQSDGRAASTAGPPVPHSPPASAQTVRGCRDSPVVAARSVAVAFRRSQTLLRDGDGSLACSQ
ncbi:hypothetical protein [Streptomyces sp. NPDC058457]|uniref:hypothetical protein n=1 Tax=Streptomyces sp. NPDC058457 TaxID=3346507 RepID=UPI0036698800